MIDLLLIDDDIADIRGLGDETAERSWPLDHSGDGTSTGLLESLALYEFLELLLGFVGGC